MNIKFSYRYRDAANYKNHDEIIFSNKDCLSIDEIKSRIVNRLISGEFFYNDQFGVPDLHFEKWDNEYDHLWHEFVDTEETTDNIFEEDINEILERIEKRIEFKPNY